ncbi:MAG: hypothetical protein KKE36_12640 [Actinobacteria bacterium]|nr:hypothetical protein [Actinomycetota bacterium]
MSAGARAVDAEPTSSAPQQSSPGVERSSQPAEPGQTPEQSAPSSQQPAEAPVVPPADQPAEQPEVLPLEPPSADPSSALGLSCPSGEIDFGGGMLVPGRTYTETIHLGVQAKGAWTLRMEKDHGLVGEATGESIPSSCMSMNVSSEGEGVSFVAPSGAHVGDGVTVARGSTGEVPAATQVTVVIRVYIPWDVEPDVYRMTQIYSAFAI